MKTKNKKEEQLLDRNKHKENRRKAPNLERPDESKEVKPTILIVCDGENTEPSYFKQFRSPSTTIKIVGKGFNTTKTVEEAIEQSKETLYDQVWCVFDADPKPDNKQQAPNFNKAIKLAESHDLKIAYSNQAFEYWIILHFDDHQGGKMPRTDYHKKINDLLKPHKVKYDGHGSKIITAEIFEILDGIDEKTGIPRSQLAINRAKKVYDNLDHKNPAREESSTTVFRLVEELLKWR